MAASDQQAVWAHHAHQWAKLGSPLKPCREDSQLLQSAMAPALAGKTAPAIGVLGVTPEIVQAPWPASTRLQAFDHSRDIIASVWKPNSALHSTAAFQAKWQQLPLESASLDGIVGDNAFGALPGLSVYPQVLQEIARVLKPDGLLCLRYLCLPEQVAGPEQLADEAMSGRIESFHALKWRIAMTLSRAPDYSVATADILATFNGLFPDRRSLARASRWPETIIDTIDAYKGTATRYSAAPLAVFESQVKPWFAITAAARGHYELAAYCPTLTLKPLTGAHF